MDFLRCYIDPYSEKQMIRDSFSHKEYWVKYHDLCEKLYDLCVEKGYKKVRLEGSYFESFELMGKFQNMYPTSDIVLYTI